VTKREPRIPASTSNARPAIDMRAAIPLALFGIPLGIAGLAGGWTAASLELDAPTWPAEALYGASSALWIVLIVLYAAGAARHRGTFLADIMHPATGTFASLIPLVAILLAVHYSQYAFTVFAGICVLGIAILAIVAAQLIARWLRGQVELNSFHGGYFIPVVAGPNIASIGFSAIHEHQAAIAALGAGLFFWVAITAAVIIRMAGGDELPVGMKPGMAAFLAATATTNLAWLFAHPGGVDEMQQILTGVLVLMLLVQFFLLGEYGKLRFSLSWWIFTFPLASTTNYAVRWMSLTRIPGWNTWSWCVLAATTIFILYISARTAIASVCSRLERV
jgi:tellurite resistance protein